MFILMTFSILSLSLSYFYLVDNYPLSEAESMKEAGSIMLHATMAMLFWPTDPIKSLSNYLSAMLFATCPWMYKKPSFCCFDTKENVEM